MTSLHMGMNSHGKAGLSMENTVAKTWWWDTLIASRIQYLGVPGLADFLLKVELFLAPECFY